MSVKAHTGSCFDPLALFTRFPPQSLLQKNPSLLDLIIRFKEHSGSKKNEQRKGILGKYALSYYYYYYYFDGECDFVPSQIFNKLNIF